MRNASGRRLFMMAVLLLSVLIIGTRGPIGSYVEAVKLGGSADIAFRADGSDGGAANNSLHARLVEEAKKLTIAPVNARVDRVWKAIPGYDGREPDLEATWAKAKAMNLPDSAPADRIPWVFKRVPPAIGLADLPPNPVYRGNSAKPTVGLMINVAWGDVYLPSILDTLDKEKVKATFFLDGSWLAKHTDTAKEMLRRGHELSNHAYSHKQMSTLSDERQRQEINRTEVLLKQLGVQNKWFAPPSGDFDGRTVRIASQMGLTTVMWSLDTVDWRKPSASAVVAKVAGAVAPGTLILMHPTQATEGGLAGMIRAIRAKGLVPGTVTDTLSSQRIQE